MLYYLIVEIDIWIYTIKNHSFNITTDQSSVPVMIIKSWKVWHLLNLQKKISFCSSLGVYKKLNFNSCHISQTLQSFTEINIVWMILFLFLTFIGFFEWRHCNYILIFISTSWEKVSHCTFIMNKKIQVNIHVQITASSEKPSRCN